MPLGENTLSCKGSIVVEASIIMPLVILCVMAVIYLSIVLWQQTCLQAGVNLWAERGAASWTNVIKDVSTGKPGQHNNSINMLYWRILDSNKKEKEEKILQFISSNNFQYKILEGDREIYIQMKDYIIYKKLQIIANETFTTPFGDVLGIFGVKRQYRINAAAEAVVEDSVEFIRNIDFILDMKKDLERKYPELGDIGGKAGKMIDKIKGGLSLWRNSEGVEDR